MKFFWSCSIQSICVRLFRVRLAWRFSVKEKILDCVKGGGTLIVEGVESIELFRKELQIDECVPVQERPLSIVRGGDMRALASCTCMVRIMWKPRLWKRTERRIFIF